MTKGTIFRDEDIVEMLNRLAHEVRNPLANVDSSAQILLRLAGLDEASTELVLGIRGQVKRVNDVIRSIQRFIRLDRHTISEMDIDEAVRLAFQIVEARGRFEHGHVAVRPGPVCSVLTDRDLLPGAIAEILDNALTFSRQVTIGWTKTGPNELEIFVDDEGPGIGAEIEDSICRPFFSTSTRGTGLGLNIARRACRLLGGELSWQNRSEVGTRFIITTPCVVS